MKKFVVILALAIVAALAIVPVFAEAVDLGDSGELPDGGTEEVPVEGDVNKFNEVMTELYEYWQEYNTTEGGNSFEKLVNFAWKYRGDVGGVVAAIAILEKPPSRLPSLEPLLFSGSATSSLFTSFPL